MVDSPVVEVVRDDRRAPAVGPDDYTPDAPQVAGLSHEDRRRLFWRLYRSGRPSEAKGLCLLCASHPLGPFDLAKWAHNLAMVERDEGNLHTALFIIESVAGLASEADDETAGYNHNGRARILEMMGRRDEALGEYEEALYCFDRIRDPFAAGVLNNIGRIHTALGNFDKAKLSLERAYSLAFGDIVRMGEIKESLALVYEAKGMLPEARREAGESLSLLANAGDRRALQDTWQTVNRLDEKLEADRQAAPPPPGLEGPHE